MSMFPRKPWCVINCHTADQNDFSIEFKDAVSLEVLNLYVKEKFGNNFRCYILKQGTLKRLRRDSDFQSMVKTRPDNVDIFIKLSRTLSKSDHVTPPTSLNFEGQSLDQPALSTQDVRRSSQKNIAPNTELFQKGHRRTRSTPGNVFKMPSSYISEPLTPDFVYNRRSPSLYSRFQLEEGGGCFVPASDGTTFHGKVTPDSGFQSPESLYLNSFSTDSSSQLSTPAAGWDSADMPRHLLEEFPLSMDNSSIRLVNNEQITHRELADNSEVFETINSCPENFQINEMIGSGGFAKVYHCLDLDTGRDLAVKQVQYDPNCKDSVKELAALQNEIEILNKLRHPHIVTYFGSSSENGLFNIFMEFVSGGSLRQYIQKNGPLSVKLAIKSLAHMLLGLEYLHKQNIIHRDLKAANVLKNSSGVIKLADFGASKRLQTLKSLSGANTVVGTPYWMAPEVIKSQGTYNNKVDVWGIGATAVEFLTGRPPFFHLEPMAAMFKIASNPLIYEVKFSNTIPDSLQTFIFSCLEFSPSNRPSANELLGLPIFNNYL